MGKKKKGKKKKANEIAGCTKRLMNSSWEMTSPVYMALVKKDIGTVCLVLKSSMLKTKLKNWKRAIKLFKSLEKCLETNDLMNLTCLAHQKKLGIKMYSTSKRRKSWALEKTLVYGRKAFENKSVWEQVKFKLEISNGFNSASDWLVGFPLFIAIKSLDAAKEGSP